MKTNHIIEIEKLVAFLVLLCLFGLPAASQESSGAEMEPSKTQEELKEQAKKAKNKHLVRYDKFDDQILVSALPYNLVSVKERLNGALFGDSGIVNLWFGSGFEVRGERLERNNARFFLIFSAESTRQQFRRRADLTVIFDDQKLRLTPIDGDVEVDRFIGETILFEIDRQPLMDIANAKTAELKIGNYVQRLTERHKEMLLDTLFIGDPDSKGKRPK